ncbi:hypothetical protein ACFYUY_38425 [Kitasatospora sp. NPDC004745]|uniref:hypothetical protein n=1 Tax=Kitasatospora sp. NPDC004745 TaxID=3364019 RepID=UPI0036B44C17
MLERNGAVAAVRAADSRLTEAIGRAVAGGLPPEDLAAALAPLVRLVPVRDLDQAASLSAPAGEVPGVSPWFKPPQPVT